MCSLLWGFSVTLQIVQTAVQKLIFFAYDDGTYFRR